MNWEVNRFFYFMVKTSMLILYKATFRYSKRFQYLRVILNLPFILYPVHIFSFLCNFVVKQKV